MLETLVNAKRGVDGMHVDNDKGAQGGLVGEKIHG
jgi:hypothetical protein